MDIEEQFELEHLFLFVRKCRICGKVKDLIDGFYLTRKDRGTLPSSYSYECKICTVERIRKNRKNKNKQVNYNYFNILSEYPDW